MMRDIFYFFQMDLIFSNPGFLHIAQKICHNLNPEALKTFCYTNKNVLAHCNAMWMEILKQNHFNAKYFNVPTFMQRSLLFDKRLEGFLNHLANFFSENLMNTKQDKLSFQFQVKCVPIKVPFYFANYYLMKALCVPIYHQDLESVKYLLRPMKEYDTCVRTLIRAKNICNSLGFKISEKQHAQIVQQIAKACKNPNQSDSSGNTAIHLAAQKGQFEVVKVLLPFCKSLNAKNHKQKTAMQVAYENGHHKIVKLLLQNISFKTCIIL